jgi:PAS domain S-box-containing protein
MDPLFGPYPLTMQTKTFDLKKSLTSDFLSGGGEMGERIRQYDWSQTTLGPIESWPQSLRTCIRIMLTSRQPIWIGWGKELIKFYNDPYIAIVGGKHPWALGKPASVVWKDIWKDIEAMLKQVMEKDQGTYVESQLLIMERNGYAEETYYTFSYTPVPGDDGRTEGMFCANTDDTDKIISERQLRTLTQLGKRLADCKNNTEIINKTIATLEENPQDFPFALFRTIEHNKARLVHSTLLGASENVIPKELDLHGDHPISNCINKVLETRKPEIYKGLTTGIGQLPKGAWEIPPNDAIVLPIFQSGLKDPHGILTVGLNPYRLLDEKYFGFFTLVADQIATSFADVHILEEERKRAEALAEIDRAKTIFFSNISHEFRTPLTLLLGPVEEIMNDPETSEENKLRADVAFRNALRMQRLVNTLLDFSRIEAGRMEGRFSQVDICAYTKELAGTFQSAIEKAGMQLKFDCRMISDEVYIDLDMWEKIVINLISNAFKYSREGSIQVDVKQNGSEINFSVKDTGIGIPADQTEKIFDRFHRVENMTGRSQEGTGIGLAMVRELVRIHHGTIEVESEPGKGSTFTVKIPVGKEHLSPDKIVEQRAKISDYADAFIQEAFKWIPENRNAAQTNNDTSLNNPESFLTAKYKVLLADDNADMRDYITRLLSPHFNVVTVPDGEEAFKKIIEFNPDLVVSDIMMPNLDGFGLLKKIRNHPDRKLLPVIFLSARAGEDAKVEGLEAGADDYLVKPFSAKELQARVEANIKIAKARIAAENNLRKVIMQSPVAMTIIKGKNFVIEIANERATELWGKTYSEVINRPAFDVFPELISQGFDKILEGVYTTGEAFVANEMPITLVRHGEPQELFINFIYEASRNENDQIDGIIGVGIDVTPQVIARNKIEQSQQELNEMANAVPQLVWVARADGEVIYYNDRVAEFSGAHLMNDGSWQWQGLVHPDDIKATEKAWTDSVKNGTPYQIEHRIQMKDGSYRWFLSRSHPQKDRDGNVIKFFGSATDIHSAKEQSTFLEEEVKRRTQELSELNTDLLLSNKELQQFAHVASHDLKEPLRKIKTFAGRLSQDELNLFSDKSKLFLEKINSASDRMAAMIEGVLNYSVLNAREQNILPVDLNEVIKNIETDLELPIAQKNAVVSYSELPTVEGSSILLYQLFYNLVNNSLKFSRPDVAGRIALTSEFTGTEQNGFACIRIKDNGIGFEQEFAERIFESFTRLNSKDHYEGTGLGLSLCKRIAERHGGSIAAFGEPGVGSVFEIMLPLKQLKKSI